MRRDIAREVSAVRPSGRGVPGCHGMADSLVLAFWRSCVTHKNSDGMHQDPHSARRIRTHCGFSPQASWPQSVMRMTCLVAPEPEP